MKKPAVVHTTFPLYTVCYFAPETFNIFSFSFGFGSLILICLVVVFFEFILFVVHWASQIWKFMSLIRIGKLSIIISSNTSPAPFSFFLWDSNYAYVRPSDTVPQVTEVLFILFNFFSLHSSDLIISIDLYQVYWLFCHL